MRAFDQNAREQFAPIHDQTARRQVRGRIHFAHHPPARVVGAKPVEHVQRHARHPVEIGRQCVERVEVRIVGPLVERPAGRRNARARREWRACAQWSSMLVSHTQLLRRRTPPSGRSNSMCPSVFTPVQRRSERIRSNTPLYFSMFSVPSTQNRLPLSASMGRICRIRLNGGFDMNTSDASRIARHSSPSRSPSYKALRPAFGQAASSRSAFRIRTGRGRVEPRGGQTGQFQRIPMVEHPAYEHAFRPVRTAVDPTAFRSGM